MQIGRDAHEIKSLSRHTLEQVVALCGEGIVLLDARDRRLPVVYANAAYEALSGYAFDELNGRPWALLARDGDAEPDAERSRLAAAIDRAEACRVTVPELRKDGTSWTAEIHLAPLQNSRGDLQYFLCVHRAVERAHGEAPADSAATASDVSETTDDVAVLKRELRTAKQKIANLDRTDPVTGLLRFSHFQQTLQRDLAMARREGRFVTIMVFNIVELDVYRQTFGDKAADSCQRMVGAQMLRTLRRAGDLCARYDDSTLVAAALGQTPEDVQHLADQIADYVRRLSLHNPRGKTARHITAQVAVIGRPPGARDDVEGIILRALAELRGAPAAARAASSP